MRALLVGSPGRAPFTGHFRGRWAHGGAELAWSGRIRGSGSPEEGWAAAEAAREAFLAVCAALGAGAAGGDRFAAIQTAWTALRSLESSDLSVLLVAADGEGVAAAACGLEELRGDGRVLAPPGHPLYDEPGIREKPGYFHPEGQVVDWVGVPLGCRWTGDPVERLCGARTST